MFPPSSPPSTESRIPILPFPSLFSFLTLSLFKIINTIINMGVKVGINGFGAYHPRAQRHALTNQDESDESSCGMPPLTQHIHTLTIDRNAVEHGDIDVVAINE